MAETKSNFLDLSKSELDKDILEESKDQSKPMELVTSELEALKASCREFEEREA